MIYQTPRYLLALLVVATALILLSALHSSGAASTAISWNSHSYDQETTQPIAAPAAAKKPFFGSKNDDDRPTFTDLALISGTDKVTDNNYGILYDKYLPAFRDKPVRMIEIGLGCGMSYGPGASYNTWMKYFPHVDLNIVEYDETCGKAWAAKNPEATVFYGDQASAPFIRKVGADVTAAGPVDIIVDDGGHTMTQQENSLRELWPFLRPGGIYFAEDLHTSFMDSYGGDASRADPTKRTFMTFIHELVDDFMAAKVGVPSKNAWYKEIASIDCMEALCVLTKKEKGAR